MRKTPAPDEPYDAYHNQHQYQQRSPSRSRARSRSRSRTRARTPGTAAADADYLASDGSTDMVSTDAEADDDVEAGRVMVVQASG